MKRVFDRRKDDRADVPKVSLTMSSQCFTDQCSADHCWSRWTTGKNGTPEQGIDLQFREFMAYKSERASTVSGSI